MPIVFACVVLEMFRRMSLPSTATIAGLADLQSATYHA